MVKNLPVMEEIKVYNLPNVYWDLTALSVLVCLAPKVHILPTVIFFASKL